MSRVAYLQLRNIWKPKGISLTTTLRLINTNVKLVQLYGSESVCHEKPCITDSRNSVIDELVSQTRSVRVVLWSL